MSSESLHEDAAVLGPDIVDQHRAIVSLMEELEAVDWYNQRARATSDDGLRALLEHNRDEEKEHAAMALEMDAPGSAGADVDGGSSDGSLGIGSLRRRGGDAA